MALVEDLSESEAEEPGFRRRLEDFLYGPESPASSVPRNAQGAVYRGNRLFCSDQGLPGVLELRADGSARLFSHFREAPACPVDLAFDDSGRLYVADTTLRKILVYDENGRRTGSYVPPEESRSFRPAAVSYRQGILYVSSSAGKCIERLDVSAGQWLEPWGANEKKGFFGMPAGLAFSESGELLVADALLGVVHRMTVDGQRMGTIGRRGRGQGELVRPTYLATMNGLVMVTDSARQSLMVFEEDGQFVLEVGGPRDRWEGFTLPSGIAVLPGIDGEIGATGPAATDNGFRAVVSDTLGVRPFTRITFRRVSGAESPSDRAEP